MPAGDDAQIAAPPLRQEGGEDQRRADAAIPQERPPRPLGTEALAKGEESGGHGRLELGRLHGDLAARVDAFQNRYVIPTDKVGAVMEAGIAACKAKTEQHLKLPAGERFDLEFVTKKPWSGYNWYKGDAHSLIQINTDLPIYISRALDLGCHEGYPGHHVLNSLLEEKLTKGKGWVEFSIYPLFSPQSLIAEGSANYGIALAFLPPSVEQGTEVVIDVRGSALPGRVVSLPFVAKQR